MERLPPEAHMRGVAPLAAGGVMLDYIALGILFFVVISMVYIVIAIHDIPYKIAKSRSHPHQDAIHAAGWVSLFTLHAIWPFLWIWAMLYRPDRGWGMRVDAHGADVDDMTAMLLRLEKRVAALERGAAETDTPEKERQKVVLLDREPGVGAG
jgi:hypothetical protein